MTAAVPGPRLRDTLGQTVLNALLRTRQQPNSGALALEVADALLPVFAAELARVQADSQKRAAEELRKAAEGRALPAGVDRRSCGHGAGRIV